MLVVTHTLWKKVAMAAVNSTEVRHPVTNPSAKPSWHSQTNRIEIQTALGVAVLWQLPGTRSQD